MRHCIVRERQDYLRAIYARLSRRLPGVIRNISASHDDTHTLADVIATALAADDTPIVIDWPKTQAEPE